MTAAQAVLWNFLLALLWALALGDLSVGTLITGYLIGFVVLWVTRRAVGAEVYPRKIGKLIRLVGFFLRDLISANLRVAYDVITPRYHMKPAVIAIPLDVRTDGEITLLANLITLTPGTLSLDVSADRKALYIHSMYTPDADALRLSIKRGLESRILEVTR